MKKSEEIKELTRLYESHAKGETAQFVSMGGGGSDRDYWRIIDAKGETVIGVANSNASENSSFISLSKNFSTVKGVNVPKIYSVSDDERFYLEEDLGDTSLFSMLHTDEGRRLTEECMRALPKLQCCDPALWEPYVMSKPFGKRQALWDLNYFKYEFLKQHDVTFDEDALEDDFESFAAKLSDVPSELEGFMYRDCQSRNVMVYDKQAYWIDYQGGRRGPGLYDAISFAWQAKANFTNEERERLINAYIEGFTAERPGTESDIRRLIDVFALFRTLQVLGAYGYRGLVQRRSHFIESIPGALANLNHLINKGASDELPELKGVCQALCTTQACYQTDKGTLTVKVSSFSYKKGYPVDNSGNGGGFVFDCRAMHNPGRYEQYKRKTGLDRDVIAFLEERGEVQTFLHHAHELVDRAVKRYLDRGFTSLSIGFGCTGGQHRSVYCAEHMGRHLSELFPQATIIIEHREQGITTTLPTKS